jgi:hypothetical protein
MRYEPGVRHLILLAIALSPLAFTGSPASPGLLRSGEARASNPRPAESPYLERARFERIRQGVTALAPDLGGDVRTVNRGGREDIVAFSTTPSLVVLGALKEAYSSRARIGGIFTVEGWAHLAATDSYTFTVEDASGKKAVIEVSHDPQGVRVVFWGLPGGPPPPRRPLTDLPVRIR